MRALRGIAGAERPPAAAARRATVVTSTPPRWVPARASQRVLRHGRHDEHGGEDHVDRTEGHHPRPIHLLEHLRTRFAMTPTGPFTMKRPAVPMSVLAVGEGTRTREGRDDSRLPYLGRDEEAIQVRQGASRGGSAVSTASSPSTAPRAWADHPSRTRPLSARRRGPAGARPDFVVRRRALHCLEHVPDAAPTPSTAAGPPRQITTSSVRRASPTLAPFTPRPAADRALPPRRSCR